MQDSLKGKSFIFFCYDAIETSKRHHDMYIAEFNEIRTISEIISTKSQWLQNFKSKDPNIKHKFTTLKKSETVFFQKWHCVVKLCNLNILIKIKSIIFLFSFWISFIFWIMCSSLERNSKGKEGCDFSKQTKFYSVYKIPSLE